jgi:hypothetical protein
LPATSSDSFYRHAATKRVMIRVDLRWAVDRLALFKAMQSDGPYLLVTNDFNLAPRRMSELYPDTFPLYSPGRAAT